MEESEISLAASVEQPKTILLISFISSWSQQKMKQLTANEGQKSWVGCFGRICSWEIKNRKTRRILKFRYTSKIRRCMWTQEEQISTRRSRFLSVLLYLCAGRFHPLPLLSSAPPTQPLSYLHNNLLSFTPMNEQWQRCPCDRGHRRCCCGNSQT